MNLINILKSTFTIFTLMSFLCSITTFAQDTDYTFGSVQKLSGSNGTDLKYTANNPGATSMSFLDRQDRFYGKIYGSTSGTRFGLVDGSGSWSYRTIKNSLVSIHVGGSEMMRIKSDGNVGIGTTTPQNKLDVCGTIRGKEVLVEDTWCDFVFDADYDLPTLEEEKEHIATAGYLLGFESEEEMGGEINVGDVTKRQQQKIEEQMLHIIGLNDENKALKELVEGLVKDVATLKSQVQK